MRTALRVEIGHIHQTNMFYKHNATARIYHNLNTFTTNTDNQRLEAKDQLNQQDTRVSSSPKATVTGSPVFLEDKPPPLRGIDKSLRQNTTQNLQACPKLQFAQRPQHKGTACGAVKVPAQPQPIRQCECGAESVPRKKSDFQKCGFDKSFSIPLFLGLANSKGVV